jgi:hypothetical protein
MRSVFGKRIALIGNSRHTTEDLANALEGTGGVVIEDDGLNTVDLLVIGAAAWSNHEEEAAIMETVKASGIPFMTEDQVLARVKDWILERKIAEALDPISSRMNIAEAPASYGGF